MKKKFDWFGIFNRKAKIEERKEAEKQRLVEIEERKREREFPIDEDAKILPYVYYPENEFAMEAFELTVSQAMAMKQRAVYTPKAKPGCENVLGFKINENLTLLRYWGEGFYPDNCYFLAKCFGGRIPTQAEMIEINAKLPDVNKSFFDTDNFPLCKGDYLISDTAAPYYSKVVNIEEPETVSYCDFDDGCSFLVVK